MKRLNLRGQVIGRLTVLMEAAKKGEKTRWLCRCKCGNHSVAHTYDLTHQKHLSCGCLQKERASETSLTHGLTNTREYNIWTLMKGRCLNPIHPRFKDYGWRGITVCARWMTFANFISDMGTSPTSKHSIDRINNDGNYSPDNCRWATARQQRLNSVRKR